MSVEQSEGCAAGNSAQKLNLNVLSSLMKQDFLKNDRKNPKFHRESQEKSIIRKVLWTQYFANIASVPKMKKEETQRVKINQSEVFRRDESIRKRSLCTETAESEQTKYIETDGQELTKTLNVDATHAVMYYNYSNTNLAFPGEQIMEMKYCMHCGHKLDEKYLMGEGMVPYCPECQEFRFPVYNTAVSMIVMNKELDKVLLIKQYGRDSYILVAGYVNKGEDAEDAVKREVGEEMGLQVLECHFNRSHYFAPSNTLMLNFTAIVEEGEPSPNSEIDAWKWFSVGEARARIRDKSLAQAFLNGFFDGEYHF